MSENREGYTYIDRRTDTYTKPWNHVHTHRGMTRLVCPIGKKQSATLLPHPYLITSREVNESRKPYTCRRPCAFEGKNQKQKHQIPPHLNTPVSLQQLGNRGSIYTACDETRPTRLSILARFHRFRGYGSRPRTALAMSEDHEGYIYTDGQTD